LTRLQAAALGLAKRGLYVFPCAARGKVPLTKHGCLDASIDADIIRSWWQQHPDANIGLACGPRSNVWVLDVDGQQGEQALQAIERGEVLKLPPTWEVTTGVGRHIYFRWPDDLEDTPVIKNSTKQLGPGLDVRSEGGYVIAPPSIHPSGRQYRWREESGPGFAYAPLRFLLLLQPQVTELDVRRPTEHWAKITREGAPEGMRNASAASLAGYLLRMGIDAHTALDLVLAWNATKNRPPLPNAEIIRTVESIAAREIQRLRGLAT
jgi:hypothetical protein